MTIYLGDLVAFLVLMQNGKGLLSKAPSYIDKKFRFIDRSERGYIEDMLDSNNLLKWQEWFDYWNADPNEEVVF